MDMTFSQFLTETAKYAYLGQCDRVRMCGSDNEANWQVMMRERKPIVRDEFVRQVDLTPVLDEGEGGEEWLNQHTDAQFFRSRWGDANALFLQTKGFEFIFVKKT